MRFPDTAYSIGVQLEVDGIGWCGGSPSPVFEHAGTGRTLEDRLERDEPRALGHGTKLDGLVREFEFALVVGQPRLAARLMHTNCRSELLSRS